MCRISSHVALKLGERQKVWADHEICARDGIIAIFLDITAFRSFRGYATNHAESAQKYPNDKEALDPTIQTSSAPSFPPHHTKTSALQLPGGRDVYGAPYILYNANRHIRRTQEGLDMAALKAVLYLAEQAAVQHNALRTGVSILANFNGVGFNRMDNRLHRQVVELLTGAYPGRICRVYIVKPSRVFSVFLRVAGTFAKKKLISKLVTVPSFENLKSHIEPDQLLPAFGGTLEYDHGVWVDSRLVRRPNLFAVPQLGI